MEGGGTLQEWGGRRAVMDAFPTMDCYEDMFKEITRKLYGEDGLPDMNEGDHGSGVRAPPDYDGESPESGGHGALAAFGLAALMQNGFPPPPGMFGHHHHLQTESIKYRPTGEDKWVSSDEALQWTSSKIATYNAAQKLFHCTECECVGFLSRVAEHWLGTHANLRVFQCPQCPYASAWARCVRMHLQRQHNVIDTGENSSGLWKENPVLEEVTKYLQRLKSKVESPSNQNGVTPSSTHSNLKTEFVAPTPNHGHPHNSTPSRQAQAGGSENTPSKRYCCTFCPYATDRRDLFTRHENIHRDEKPFQCYVCQKQFNRADHVKKHFLRMHRDHPYDLNRIRRHPPKNSNGMSYYQKYNSPQQNPQRPQGLGSQGQLHHGLNIPTGFPPPPSSIRGVKPPLGSPPKMQQNGCNAKSHGSKTAKKKGEKRYSCCYCAWSGVDNWCLKRHLNTHLKPFVCGLCDYKAARSERLATHVLKVHNKRACGRCSFLGEDSAQLAIHMQEHHPLEHRNNRSSNNVLRSTNFANNYSSSSLPSSFCSHDSVTSTSSQSSRRHFEEASTPGLWNPHGHVPSSYALQEESWKNSNKHFGAARLFHYMEASDNSEPENEPEEEEPPPFICRECGCEFIDDTSLETHVFMHHRSAGPRTIKQEPIRSLAYKYKKYCSTPREESPLSKRHRKQQQPKKIVSAAEIRVVRRSPKRRWKKQPVDFISQLRDKHISSLIMRKGLRCFWCRSWTEVFPYHTVSSLALHKLWHHKKDKFECEHCQVRYRHRYQVVLHASRAHFPIQTGEQMNDAEKENEPEMVLEANDGENTFRNPVPILVSHAPEVLHGSEGDPKNPPHPPPPPPPPDPVLPPDISEMSMKIPNFLASIQDIQPANQFAFRAPEEFPPPPPPPPIPPAPVTVPVPPPVTAPVPPPVIAPVPPPVIAPVPPPVIAPVPPPIPPASVTAPVPAPPPPPPPPKPILDQDVIKTDALETPQEVKSFETFDKPAVEDETLVKKVVAESNVGQDSSQELKPLTEIHPNNNNIPQMEISEKANESSLIPTNQIQDLIDSSTIQGGSGPMPLVIPSYPPSG